MKRYENSVSPEFINEINAYLDTMKYENSMWVFPGEDATVRELIQKHLFVAGSPIMECLDGFPPEKVYSVIRAVKFSDTKRAFEIHYDNYEDTLLIPLKLPKDEPKGDIHIYENSRRRPSNILWHVIVKVLVQNKFAIRFMLKHLKNNFIKVSVLPGDVVQFNGFRSLHYNEGVSSERRSLLIHYNKPFENSFIVKLIEAYSRFKVR
jgi:hypothetical protein